MANEEFVIVNGRLTKYNGMGGDVVVPEGVTTIFAYSFGDAPITSVVLPASLTQIDAAAFRYCASLATINVNEGNTAYRSVDGVVYTKDGTKLIVLPCAKTRLTILGSVKRIPARAFEGNTRLTSVVLEEGVEEVGEDAFGGCANLREVIFAPSVRWISYRAFKGCPLESVRLFAPTQATGPMAFLASQGIGQSAFENCTRLVAATMPTNIGPYVFRNCSNLERVALLPCSDDKRSGVGSGAFDGCAKLARIDHEGVGQALEKGCFGTSLPVGLSAQVCDLWTIMKDGALVQYILESGAWETFDAEQQADLILARANKSLCPHFGKLLSNRPLDALIEATRNRLAHSRKEECVAAVYFIKSVMTMTVTEDERLVPLYRAICASADGGKAVKLAEKEIKWVVDLASV